jgi:hypothetical protein
MLTHENINVQLFSYDHFIDVILFIVCNPYLIYTCFRGNDSQKWIDFFHFTFIHFMPSTTLQKMCTYILF